jgi:hypothetical protein
MPLKRLHLKEGESEIRVSESNLAFPMVKRATKSPPPIPENMKGCIYRSWLRVQII